MKTAVSRADLLQSLVTIDKDNLSLVADCFGYENTATGKTDGAFTFSSPPPPRPPKLPPPPPPELNIPRPPEHFCRLTQISHSDIVPAVAENETIPFPDWTTNITALDLTAATRKKVTQPAKDPLVAWSRLWPVLRHILSETQQKKRPDLKKLVKILSQARQPARIPQQQKQSWTADLRILIDQSQRLCLFNDDYLHLIQNLKKLRGAAGLVQEVLDDTPGGFVSSQIAGQTEKRLWRMPEPETRLLILSDLGIYEPSGKVQQQWLLFGRKLQAAGCKAYVLLPVPVRYLSQELINYYQCISWDRFSSLQIVKIAATSDAAIKKRQTQDQQSLKKFLQWLSPLVEIEPEILRAVRYHSNLTDAPLDVSFEAQLWNHEDIVSNTCYASFVAEKLAYYRDDFLKLAALDKPKTVRFYELVKRYHQHKFLLDYYEEINTLAHAAGCEDELYQQAQDYIKQFVYAVCKNEQHDGLAYHAQRLLNRQSEQIKRNQDFLSSLWGILASRVDVGAESPDWVNISQAYPFLNQKQPNQHYSLVQRGENLYLTDGENFHAENSGLDLPFFTLAEFSTGSSLMVEEVIENGQLIAKRDYQLHKAALIEFPVITQQRRLHVNGQCYTLETLPKPSWATSIGRDSQGFFVTVPWVDEPRLYWQNYVRLTTESGDFLVDESGDYLVDEIPEYSWIGHDNVGVDEYGLYADLSIKGIIQRFRWIEPGTFLMGSPPDEIGRSDNEAQHRVTLTQGFWLADTACTQALWQAVMGNNPSKFTDDQNNPVEQVSWNVVQEFLTKLNLLIFDFKARLLTEAEWEYACRAGTITAFSCGETISTDLANYNGNYVYGDGKKGVNRRRTMPVKSLPANPWGLYEMHGNVLEWCNDQYSDRPNESVINSKGSLRVLRGGSWESDPWNLRSAFRLKGVPDNRFNYGIGFRFVLDQTGKQDNIIGDMQVDANLQQHKENLRNRRNIIDRQIHQDSERINDAGFFINQEQPDVSQQDSDTFNKNVQQSEEEKFALEGENIFMRMLNKLKPKKK